VAEKAAIRIQATYKGYKTRKQIKPVLEDKIRTISAKSAHATEHQSDQIAKPAVSNLNTSDLEQDSVVVDKQENTQNLNTEASQPVSGEKQKIEEQSSALISNTEVESAKNEIDSAQASTVILESVLNPNSSYVNEAIEASISQVQLSETDVVILTQEPTTRAELKIRQAQKNEADAPKSDPETVLISNCENTNRESEFVLISHETIETHENIAQKLKESVLFESSFSFAASDNQTPQNQEANKLEDKILTSNEDEKNPVAEILEQIQNEIDNQLNLSSSASNINNNSEDLLTDADLDSSTAAAVKIQATYRGFRTRKQFKNKS
jgi:hypothetical protein